MKNEIEILEKHFGKQENIAEALGITTRHYRNVKKGGAGKFLKLRIKFLVAEIQSKSNKNRS